LQTLKEKIMTDGIILQTVDRAGVELDVRRMELPHNLDLRYGPLLDGAIEQMQQIERGDAVNVDEARQVGHYWLRNVDLAPEEYRQDIQAALDRIDEFYERQFSGKFGNILWIGIGGSGLGPQVLYDALRVPGKTPRMFFFDNTDPSGFRRTLDDIAQAGGLANTLTVVVSKSRSANMKTMN
jgi:glucose-6-phosphate isomerase